MAQELALKMEGDHKSKPYVLYAPTAVTNRLTRFAM